ncbi:MAG TPA: trigger factor, partial [bacterium]|nr:trigger factor [bacterium]
DVPKQPLDIGDDAITAGLERIREGQSTFEVVKDRMVETGDRVYGRLTMSENDAILPGWKNRHVEIDVGEDGFFPGAGIDEKLVGAPVEGEYSFDVQFPEDYEYYKDVAGKMVRVTLQINDVKVKQRPEIDDDLAKDLGLETLEDLKKMVTEDIRRRREQEIDNMFESSLFDILLDKNDIPAPEPMVKHEAEFVVENYFSYQGEIPEEQKVKLMDSVKPMAERRVKQRLVLQRIAELENIEVTEDDLNETIRNMAEEDGRDPAEVRAKWEEEGLMDGLRKQVIQSKALKWLKENVVPVAPPPEKEQENDDGKE